jgi:SAM-dependent methyltransferase
VSWEQQVAEKLFQTMWNRGQGLYALAQPYLAGRRVAELWPIANGDPEHLRQMGAAETFVESPVLPALSFADGSLDVIICSNFLPEGSEETQAAWFGELARVLSPTGFCVLRVPLAMPPDGEGEAPWLAEEEGEGDVEADEEAELADDEWHREAIEAAPAEGEAAIAVAPADDALTAAGDDHSDAAGAVEPTDSGDDRRDVWRRFMKDAFAAVEVIEEVAFGGVSFRVPGTDDLAIVGDLSPLGAPAEFEIVLCGKNAEALPQLGESLLVPLAGYLEQVDVAASAMLEAGDAQFAEALTSEALARAEADQIRGEADQIRAEAERLRLDAERVRDEARLAAAAARDRETAREATIAALREGTDRQLRRIGDIEATLARITGERDEALRRAQSAETSVQELEEAVRRREWDVAGLEREVDRYGRAVAPKG